MKYWWDVKVEKFSIRTNCVIQKNVNFKLESKCFFIKSTIQNKYKEEMKNEKLNKRQFAMIIKLYVEEVKMTF